MKILKNSFLKLSIHRQIQIGAFGVSCCVFSLVFLLLAINCYILIEMTYSDIIIILNKKENEELETISLMLDLKNNIITDDSKITIQWLRNYIENNKNNLDFVNNLYYTNKVSYMIDIEELSADPSLSISQCDSTTDELHLSNCLFYKKLSSNTSIYESTEFKNYFKIIEASIDLIKKSFMHRFQETPNNPIFNRISIYSNEYSVVFLYIPNIDSGVGNIINTNYSLANFTGYMERACKSIGKEYYALAVPMNSIKNPENMNTTYRWTPDIQVIDPNENLVFPYLNPFNQNHTISPIIATTSALYKPGLNGTEANLQMTKNMVDLVQGDFSTQMIDNITFDLVKQYKGVVLMMIGQDDYGLITPSQCYYLLKFYEIQTGGTNFERGIYPKPIYFWNCFKYNLTYPKVVYFFNDTEYMETFKRKAYLNLFPDYFNRSTEYDVYFKIFSLFSPDKSTIAILNSDFLINTSTFIFTFKNSNYLANRTSYIRMLLNFKLLEMLMINVLILYLCLIIIIGIILHVTTNIIRPINELISQVANYGRVDQACSAQEQRNAFRQQQKALDKITYPDDHDINDMVQICKSLIRGGFSESTNNNNTRNKNRVHMLNSYNNISYIKSNNLILSEDLNNDKLLDNHPIFNWTVGSNSSKNTDNLNNSEYCDTEKDFSNKDEMIMSDRVHMLNSNLNNTGRTIKNQNNHPMFLDFEDVRLNASTNNNIELNKSSRGNTMIFNSNSTSKPDFSTSIFTLVAEEERRHHSSPYLNQNYLYTLFMKHTNNGEDLKISSL